MISDSPIFTSLNDPQREAVSYRGGPLLILAGAGSGKTRVLTHRIAHLIESGIPPHEVLALTFTNKAADVMRSRIASLVYCRVHVGTFHSACLGILREEAEAIGYPRSFTVYDEQDQLVIVKECMNNLGLSPDRLNPRGILEGISRAKDDLKTVLDYANGTHDRYEESTARVYEAYQAQLGELKGMDYGDLIMQTVTLFETRADILLKYQERYPYVFIDEYQDTNHAQYRFVKRLAEKSQQITVVGDPDQSIYAWRGADINNILDFEQDFPGTKIVTLDQNYRSTNNILEAANELISHNRSRKEKNLWSDRGMGEPIRLYQAPDEKEEAAYVIRKILAFRAAGHSVKDMVIFYRVHAQSRVFEDELRRVKLNYKIVGGVRFYDRKEIKDIVAYLRVVANPSDDVSLKRIVNVPVRGLGKKGLETLSIRSNELNIPLLETLHPKNMPADLKGKARAALTSFYQLIERARTHVGEWNVSKITEEILRATGYTDILEGEHSIEAKMRLENIQEFLTVVEEFEESYRREEGAETSMLSSFLERISLATEMDRWNETEDMLTLMSLHSAKGLEFPIVFMVGLEEGLFPHSFDGLDGEGDLEEERRLCYVGMTRAKDILHITYAITRFTYGRRLYPEPSRFLTELPSEHLRIEGKHGIRNEGRVLDEELDRALALEVERAQAQYERAEIDIDDEDDPFL